MSPTGFLDPPALLTGANEAAFWAFTAGTIVMVVLAVVLAGSEALRLRSGVPLVVLASATIWFPNEALMDTVLGFQYAADSPVQVMEVAGRDLPLEVIGVGAMFFLVPWLIYRAVQQGVSTGRIVLICAVAGVVDWVMEWAAIHWNVFEYYGDNPSRILGLPLTSMVQNVFLYCLFAAVLLLCVPHLKGWRSLLVLPVVPGCYFTAAFMCTWPYYLALHAGWSTGVFWLCTVVSVAANAYIPLLALRIARESYERREAVAERELVAV